MKKNINKGLALAMMANMMMAAAENPYYSLETPKRTMSDEEKRAQARILCPVDLSEREFYINGERIMAHDRKTALKIYSNRHPETKKKRKRR